jgi:hypothetical protein
VPVNPLLYNQLLLHGVSEGPRRRRSRSRKSSIGAEVRRVRSGSVAAAVAAAAALTTSNATNAAAAEREREIQLCSSPNLSAARSLLSQQLQSLSAASSAAAVTLPHAIDVVPSAPFASAIRGTSHSITPPDTTTPMFTGASSSEDDDESSDDDLDDLDTLLPAVRFASSSRQVPATRSASKSALSSNSTPSLVLSSSATTLSNPYTSPLQASFASLIPSRTTTNSLSSTTSTSVNKSTAIDVKKDFRSLSTPSHSSITHGSYHSGSFSSESFGSRGRRFGTDQDTIPLSTYVDGSVNEQEDLSPYRLFVIMVGLPARGKSFIAQKLCRYLNWLGYSSKVFNLGKFRRENLGNFHSQDYFDPNNEEVCLYHMNVAKPQNHNRIALCV